MALARRMADKLKQKRQYRDASQVLSQYVNDTEEAIVMLLEGGAWADALCMVSDVKVVIHLMKCNLHHQDIFFQPKS